MASELRPKEYVSEFVSDGPKNYAYKKVDIVTARIDTICKVRSITLNYSAKQLVNFDVTKDMILGSGEPTIMVHTEQKFYRKRKGGGTVAIITEPEDKMYRI